jgi:hypothetical protein
MQINIKDNRLKAVIAILFLLIVFLILYFVTIQHALQTDMNNVQTQNNQNNNSEKDFIQNNDKAEEEVTSTDSANIEIINKYYTLLSEGKLEEAFAMRMAGDVSFEEFSSWYANIEYAEPQGFKDIGDNTYDFSVKYKDADTDAKNYGVRMSVIEGKIKTISSTEFEATEITFGDYTAFSVVRGDKVYLILKKDEAEDIIDVGDYSKRAAETGFAQTFSNLKLSPKENYLMYSTNGWEYLKTEIYDIKNKKKVENINWGPLDFIGVTPGNGMDFTPDEKYVYYCLDNGMWGGDTGVVYSVPKFNTVFRAMSEEGASVYRGGDCEYRKNENAIVFTLSEPYPESNPETKIVKYPLSGR